MKRPAACESTSGWSRCGEWPQSGNLEQHGLRHAPRDRPDLLQRAVLVVLALHREHRAGDRLDVALDVPGAELGREPGVVPAAEGRVGVGVVLRQAGAQVRRLEGVAGELDAPDRDVLDEEMRRDRDHAGHGKARGMEQGDRAAVAVPEQPRPLDADRGEERGQHLVGLAVHEVGLPALVARLGRRVPVAVAREDEAGEAVREAELARELPPHRDRAQALVQEHDRRRFAARRADPLVFEMDLPAAPGQAGERAPRRQRRAHEAALARSRSRRRKRWILPVAVFGSSAMNSIARGYL